MIKITASIMAAAMMFTACSSSEDKKDAESTEKTEITVLAAASLTDVMGELETKYEKDHPDVDLIFSFAGSGALQTQIEEGAPADIFISAAQKQMTALKDEGLMKDDTIRDLLENKVVLIVPGMNGDTGIESFEDAAGDKISLIGLGEIESVPAGRYAQEIFTYLGIWDQVEAKANFGTDVRTVLSWVENGEVDAGVVYATDAYSSDSVKIVANAPEGSCKPVIYPAGVVASSAASDKAEAFLEYLESDEATKVFEDYGFVRAE